MESKYHVGERENFIYFTSNDVSFKLYYNKYCTILTKVIRCAKKLHYNNMILNAKNKMKTTWQIINKEAQITSAGQFLL
jgi:hypothetical protein